MVTIIYERLLSSNVSEATFYPPDKANAWDGSWHSVGAGEFIRYVRTFRGGGFFEHAMPDYDAPFVDPIQGFIP